MKKQSLLFFALLLVISCSKPNVKKEIKIVEQVAAPVIEEPKIVEKKAAPVIEEPKIMEKKAAPVIEEPKIIKQKQTCCTSKK